MIIAIFLVLALISFAIGLSVGGEGGAILACPVPITLVILAFVVAILRAISNYQGGLGG